MQLCTIDELFAETLAEFKPNVNCALAQKKKNYNNKEIKKKSYMYVCLFLCMYVYTLKAFVG